MADSLELQWVSGIFEAQNPGAEGMDPQDLIADLTAQLDCTYEHARNLILEAVDRGTLKFNSSYALISPEIAL